MFKQIGTVEILTHRIYPLDGMVYDPQGGSTVIVDPGTYPLYSDGFSTCWLLDGELNNRNARKGDGLFTMGGADVKTGLSIRVPSKMYGPDDWADFCNEPVATEGHPEQRLRIAIND
jgi:hypothetical protein